MSGRLLVAAFAAAAGALCLWAFARGGSFDPPRAPSGPGGPVPPAPEAPPSAPPQPQPADPDAPTRAQAVRRGVAWLASAQEADGSWDLARWNPLHGKPTIQTFTQEDAWFGTAATGLALLAMLDADPGADPAPPGSSARRGVEYLLAHQLPDGRIGFDEREVDRWFVETLGLKSMYAHSHGPGYKALTIHTYNHAVPAAALARLWARTKEPALREPVRRAIRSIAQDEHREYRWTAYYDPDSDVGIVPYVLLAARALDGTDLAPEAGRLLSTGLDFLDRVTDAETGRTHMLSATPVCYDGDDSTAINLFCRRLLGQDPRTAVVAAAVASLVRVSPEWRSPKTQTEWGELQFDEKFGPVVNHEFWYHAVVALRDVPGREAAALRARIRGLLVRHQVAEGPLAGSWDPIGVWDRVGGRVYSTAMAVRTLAAE